MIEQVLEKGEKEGLNNIDSIQMDLRGVNLENIGKHDVIIASRSANSIYNIRDFLVNLNKIANKYVFMTVFGPDNKKHERTVGKLLNKKSKTYPHYSHVFNLLVSMGLNPNAENLCCESLVEYDDIDDAVSRLSWRLGELTSDEEKKLKEHLIEILIKNSKGKLENPNEKADWVLIWWKTKELAD